MMLFSGKEILKACVVFIVAIGVFVKKNRGADASLQALLKAEVYTDFARDPQLQKWYNLIKKEIEKAMELFPLHQEHYADKHVYFFNVQSPYSIISEISTILSEQHPQDTIIVYRATEGGWKLSARNQSGRVNLNNLIRTSIHGIGSGGGHEKAAGGFTTNWDTFKTNVLAEI